MNLVDLSIRRPIFICMITMFFIVLGLISLRSLPIDLYPNVSAPVVSVRVSYPGTSPEEIEQLVIKPLEDALSTVGGVKQLRSVSREGVGFVSLEFDIGQDVDIQEAQIRAKLSETRARLPDDIEEPSVFRQSIDEEPILELVVTGNLAASELTDIAENLVALSLRQIQGVGDVTVTGGRKQIVKVDLLPHKLEIFAINPSDVVKKLREAANSSPLGKLEGKEKSWILRIEPSVKNTFELSNMVIGSVGEKRTPLLLKEVANVWSSFEKPSRVNQFFSENTLGESVGLEVTKQSGVNTLELAKRIKSELANLEENLPMGVKFVVTSDASKVIETNLYDVIETLIIAIILTIAIVLVFLRSPRSTITTAISLPSSIITTFLAMKAAGFSLNTMTLLSLSLAIGIIVDDAIVVRENIHKHMVLYKKDALLAASEGTKEVSLAVIATTLTLVAVFLPVGALQSVTGQFFKPFALTVCFSVLISTWDALTMAPLLSAHYANIADPAAEWQRFGFLGRFINALLLKVETLFDKITEGYEKFLHWFLDKWLLQVVLLAFSIALVWVGAVYVRKGFLPSQVGSDFRVSLEGPMAVPLSLVAEKIPEVEKALTKVDSVEYFSVSAGVGFSGSASINLNVRTKPEHARSQASLAQVRTDVRKALSNIKGYTVRIREVSDPLAGGSGGGRFSPVLVSISGSQLPTIENTAALVANLMNDIKGLSDVSNPISTGLGEYRLKVDEAKATLQGVSSTALAENLKIWSQGVTAFQLKKGDTQIPVHVQVFEGDKLSPLELSRQIIFSGAGASKTSTPLSAFAEFQTAAGPNVIARENRQRTLRVFAGLQPGVALGDVLPKVKEAIASIPLSGDVRISVSGQSEQMADFYWELAFALGVGAIFVYMVLASLFESLIHPLTVMMALPLAGSGALLTLWWTNVPLDLYGGIGLVLLAGIVAKNSILIVDRALDAVRKDPSLSSLTAMLQSAPGRLRPIVMTSLAMIVGMLPVATGLGVAGATRQALGLATVGGVISSTVLSLVLIPCVFIWFEKLRLLFTRRRSAI